MLKNACNEDMEELMMNNHKHQFITGKNIFNTRRISHAVAAAMPILATLGMQAQAQQSSGPSVDEIVILGSARSFSNVSTTESMQRQQAPITSVLATIDNLPGVNVTEGDTYGFDDWATTINLRGFQTNLSEQQVGITIDGLPNGGSQYGGGAKANRFIDSANSGGVEVSQGTSDISSRTLEALGGTLNFLTSDPFEEEGLRTQFSMGDYDAQPILHAL
jgi:iron complex outermembrane recepter protein